MADPILPDPFAPSPVDPNVPQLLGQYGALVAPVPDPAAAVPPLQPGLGIPQPTLDAAVAQPMGPTDAFDQPPQGAPGMAPVGPAIGPGAPVEPPLPMLGPPEATVGDFTNDGPNAPFAAPRIESHEESLSGHPLDNPSSVEMQDYLDKLSVTDPAKFAVLKEAHDFGRAQAALGKQALADQANADWIMRDLKMQQDAKAKADADSADIAKQAQAQAAIRVDPSHYMSNRSSGQFLADVIGSIAGGFAAGQVPGGNGVNHYVEGMQKRIDADIDAQRANIANGWKGIEMQKSAVGEAFARTGDLYKATEIARQATWEAVKGQIATQAQLYDPKGTLALSAAQAYQQVSQAQAAGVYKRDQDAIKNGIEAGKAGLDVAKMLQEAKDKQAALDETKRHNLATVGVDYSRLSVEQQNQLRLDKLERDKMAQAADLAKAKAKEEAEKGTDTVGGFTPNPDGTVTVGSMKMKDGSEWRVKDAQAPEIKEVTGAVINANRLGSHLIALMNRMGTVDKVTRTGLAQEAKQTAEDYVLQLHAAEHIKSFKPTSLEYVEKLGGAADPDAFITQGQSGVRSALSNLKENFGTYLVVNGYDGKPPTLPDTSRPTPHSKTVDEERDNAVQQPQDAEVGALDHAITATGGPVGRMLFSPSGIPDLTSLQDPQVQRDTAAAATGGIGTQAQTALDAWVKELDSKDPKDIANAIAHLGSATELGGTPAIKELARKAITDHGLTIARDATGVFRDVTPKVPE